MSALRIKTWGAVNYIVQQDNHKLRKNFYPAKSYRIGRAPEPETGGCESAPNRDPIQNRSMPWMLPGNTGTARKMRPNTQLFRKRRAHEHQVLARALCKQRSCSDASSDTAPPPPPPLG